MEILRFLKGDSTKEDYLIRAGQIQHGVCYEGMINVPAFVNRNGFMNEQGNKCIRS